ncbi:MAG: ATP-binding protein [Actinomycetota bacterium]|nr:ATP-binding protein [Actinomycetota bacterium]
MELVVAVIASSGATLAVVLAARRYSRLVAQVRAAAGRAGGEASSSSERDPEAAVTMLAQAVDRARGRAGKAELVSEVLSGALEALPLGVVVVGADGEALLQNRSADSLLGTRASQVLALRAVEDLLREAASGASASRSLELFGPPRRTLSLSAVPLAAGAGAVVVEDVSDRRRLDAVRRDFVANVSHELKTPVGALGLLAETLVAEDDMDVVHRLAGRMQDEAFRVARIIEDLLDLSRLEAEETARHERVHLQAVLAEAVEQVLPAAGLRFVRLDVVDVPSSWTVLGEHRQLVSAVANLLENAVKYSDEGSAVEVRVTSDGGMIDLVVQDHGIGIPKRELDRIFERFYRVDRGRGRDTGGTGLGLAIVRHVASNHGGDVHVSSVEGDGSTFTLRLPAEPGSVRLVAEAG